MFETQISCLWLNVQELISWSDETNIQILQQTGKSDEVNWFEASHEQLGSNTDWRLLNVSLLICADKTEISQVMQIWVGHASSFSHSSLRLWFLHFCAYIESDMCSKGQSQVLHSSGRNPLVNQG